MFSLRRRHEQREHRAMLAEAFAANQVLMERIAHELSQTTAGLIALDQAMHEQTATTKAVARGTRTGVKAGTRSRA